MNQIMLTFSNSLIGLIIASCFLLVSCFLLSLDVFRKIESYFGSNGESIFQKNQRRREIKNEIVLLLMPFISVSFLLNLFFIYKFWPLINKIILM